MRKFGVLKRSGEPGRISATEVPLTSIDVTFSGPVTEDVRAGVATGPPLYVMNCPNHPSMLA
jgi:hypothetical protein